MNSHGPPSVSTVEASHLAFSLIILQPFYFSETCPKFQLYFLKTKPFYNCLIISHDVHSCATSDFDRERTVFVFSKSIHDRNSSGV